jgi:hypothetical protein
MQLWQLRRDNQLVIARAATRVRRIDNGFLQRLQSWGRRLEEQWPSDRPAWTGLQMMKRSGIQSLAEVRSSDDEVEVTHQSHRRISGPNIAKPHAVPSLRSTSPAEAQGSLHSRRSGSPSSS